MKVLGIILIVLAWCGNHLVLGQELSITNVKQHKKSLEIDIVLKNTSDKDVFIVMPNPRDKAKYSYYITSDERSGLLEIRRHFYIFPPEVITNVEYPCFSLDQVKSKEIYKETIFLNYPASPTYLFFDMKTDIGKFKSIRFQLGLLPFDDSLAELQNKKPFGRCVDGQEKISEGPYKDRTLIEVQNVLRSNEIKIN